MQKKSFSLGFDNEVEQYVDVDAVQNTAELLIQGGADVNIVGDRGNTALILASKRGENESLFALHTLFITLVRQKLAFNCT